MTLAFQPIHVYLSILHESKQDNFIVSQVGLLLHRDISKITIPTYSIMITVHVWDASDLELIMLQMSASVTSHEITYTMAYWYC